MLHYFATLLLAVILFLYGFFPISNNTANFKNDPPAQIGNVSINLTESYAPHFTKTVIFIIDAFRWDFVSPELMPYTVKLMHHKGCLSKIHVESPTVTLPRIKALTTGSIPQYIDVVRNLASSEILGDSWLHSAKKKGLKTVFYGDNTWEKLFPDFFERSEGTTSFFVWDFTEVDDNVTRNVELELQRKDWDVMIVHYLGLDHIGHVLGPFSPRMPPKLKEMDNIINKIYKNTIDDETLILVTGDHGMRDSGGHGGTTHPETTVPLISIGINCLNSSFPQTDIPANLAVLLGLNIPTTSIGKIQKHLLNSLSLPNYLYAIRYNTQLLLNKNDLCKQDFVKATYYHEQFLKYGDMDKADIAMNLYQECSRNITKELYEASSRQNMYCLFVAILVMFNVLIVVIQQFENEEQSTGGWSISTCIGIVFIQVFVVSNAVSIFFLVLLGSVLIIEVKKLWKYMKTLKLRSFLNTFLIVTSILHPITFISTSFIEEEHYYWIYFTVTLVLLVFIQNYLQKKSLLNKNATKIFLVLISIRFSMDLNSTIENSVLNKDNWSNLLVLEENYLLHHIFLVLGLFLVFFVVYLPKNTYIAKTMFLTTLLLIYLLKSIPFHSTLLGQLIWILIGVQKILKQHSWKHFWIQASVLLMKPHNVILIPFAIFAGNQICKPDYFKNVSALAVVSYMLSNCFYFLQGHRNSLASVDISIGYTGLNDYYPFLVISQVLIHTYAFQVLFNFIALDIIRKVNDQKTYWLTILALRTSVVMFTSLVMIIFSHHLFIWSVFAPKLFIESVHTAFLFVEICFWYFGRFMKVLTLKKFQVFLQL